MSAEALKDLRRMLAMFRALEGAEKVLEALAGADQRVKELTAQAGKSAADLAAAQAAHAVALEQHEARVKELTQARLNIEADAKERARQIVSDADNEANEMMIAAHKERGEAKTEAEKLCEESKSLAGGIKAKLAELAEAEGRLASARASIQKMLGG